MQIYSRYDPPVIEGLICSEPTLAQQHLKNECDINMIVERAIRTGNKEVFTTQERAEYYDVSSFTDYQSALEYLDGVDDDFSSLPSSTRKEFGNDSAKYVRFMSNPANYDKAVELGLLTPKTPIDASPPQPASTPPASEPAKKENPSGDPPAA